MKSIWITGVLVLFTLRVSAQIASRSPAPPDRTEPITPKSAPARDAYVGDDVCTSCHQQQSSSYQQTAHRRTSQLPDKSSVLGAFGKGENSFTTSNPELVFRMDEKSDGLFQTAIEGIAPYTTEHTERLDFVIGSGGKGQTYLFWKGDRLFELPISFWRELGWVNSPGYLDGVANFDRPILPRCLECHATYFETLAVPNRYRKTGFVLGISCEKCHGPGREHTAWAKSQSTHSAKSGILNPVHFPRDRQMDLCARCHAGHGTPTAATFSYIPGQRLADYVELPKIDPEAELDVHGSQVELLERSRCFQSSEMTCLTCHDVHTTQHGPDHFSKICLNCHKPEVFSQAGHPAGNNCIDCHMPRQQTNLIVFALKGKSARPEVRSHWIRIYEADKPGQSKMDPSAPPLGYGVSLPVTR